MGVCLLCGGNRQKVLVAKGADYEYWVDFQADVVRCLDCGLAFQDPKPSLADLPRYYPESYANYSVPTNFIMRTLIGITEYLAARKVVNLIGKTGTVLDVGCGDGHYLDYMRQFGDWELQGTDISQEAARAPTQKGFKVHIGALEDLNIPSKTFSLVRMNHVLEHVINPLTTLKKTFDILKPGGYLVLETPNIACPDFRIFKRYWGALHLPRHVYFFDQKTLRRTLRECGFLVKRVSFTLMTTGWALGLQNYLQSKKRRILSNGRAPYYPVLLIAFLPFLVGQKLFEKSTMMEFVAQRPPAK